MNHWLLDAIADKRSQVMREADRVQLYRVMSAEMPAFDAQAMQDMATALELAVLDMELDRFADDATSLDVMRHAAEDAFRRWRELPVPSEPMEAATQLLRASAL